MALANVTALALISPGRLLGLSGAGQYIIETAYFNTSPTYLEGDTVIINGTDGLVTQGGAMNTETADILGIVQGVKTNTVNTNSEGGTIAGPNYSLTFRTQWIPNNA